LALRRQGRLLHLSKVGRLAGWLVGRPLVAGCWLFVGWLFVLWEATPALMDPVSGFRFPVSGRAVLVRRRRPVPRLFGFPGFGHRRQGRLLHLSKAPGQDWHLRLDPIHLRV